MNVLSASHDNVINSIFLMAQTDYSFAIKNLVPLIGRLGEQRELQRQKFYERLSRDIIDGCIMPPITIAITDDISQIKGKTVEEYQQYVLDNITEFFVLDGIQRLNTIGNLVKSGRDFDKEMPIYINALICPSMDHLLYRMITLNNGQKPMTARHQIEVIASSIYDFDDIDMPIQAEKRKPGEKRKQGAFKKVDMIKSYLAFLSSSINIDNEKIIQDKMDELIASKIMDNKITNSDVQFDEVLDKVNEFIQNEDCKKWFLNQNNLIAFFAGIKKTFIYLKDMTPNDFSELIEKIELVFTYFEVSKIKLGSIRRKIVFHCISDLNNVVNQDVEYLADTLSMEV